MNKIYSVILTDGYEVYEEVCFNSKEEAELYKKKHEEDEVYDEYVVHEQKVFESLEEYENYLKSYWK